MTKHMHYFGFFQAGDTSLPESDRVCECGLRYSAYIRNLRTAPKYTERIGDA